MQLFNITDRFTVVCESLKTRNGFKHVATQMINGHEFDSVKINYINRTWEKYEFDSVMEKLADKIAPHSYEDSQALKTFIINR